MKTLAAWLMAAAMVFGTISAAHAASGATQSAAPDVVIRAATENLLGIVNEARNYFDSDPERYYAEVDTVIAPLVDFYSFSRGVMGRWGSKAYHDSLGTPGEKQKFNGQIDRFVDVFRTGLVRTYSKGLLAFSGETIEVHPADPVEVAQGLATVVQEIHARDGKSYVIRYKMRRDPGVGWKVRNVTLDTLNLGKVYQSQFASAAGKYQGDIDQVIANWSVVPSATQ